VHDKNAVAQSANSGGQTTGSAGPSNTYLTMPGMGEVLAATITSGETSASTRRSRT